MSKSKIILIIVLSLLVIGLIAGGLFLILSPNSNNGNDEIMNENKPSTNVLPEENLGESEGLGVNSGFSFITDYDVANENKFSKSQQTQDNQTFDILTYNDQLNLFGTGEEETLRVQLKNGADGVANIRYSVKMSSSSFASMEECVRKVASTLTQNNVSKHTMNIAKTVNGEYKPIQTLNDVDDANYIDATFAPEVNSGAKYTMVALTVEKSNDCYIITVLSLFDQETLILP